MSLRHVIVCVLSLLGACSSSDDSAGLNDADASFVSGQSLDFAEGDQIGVLQVAVLPNAEKVLTVRYSDTLGGSVANVQVDFALTGLAPGASLSPATAFTNNLGVATTTLHVGSTVGDLQVRARTPSGQTKTLKVSVGEALGAQLAVSVLYAGQRSISSYTVTSLPGMTCAEALDAGVAGDVSYTFPANNSAPVSFDLGSGNMAAIIGFGRDGEGAKLAAGCKEFMAPITADRAMARQALVLNLDDQPLRFEDQLNVELQLNVAASTKRLADTAAATVDAAITPAGGYAMFAEADFYLDAVASSLTKLANTAGLATLNEKRAGNGLAASLSPALTQAGVGPKVVGATVGSLLRARGAGITLSSTYKTGTLGAITALNALSTEGAQLLALSLRPTASIATTFSPEKAQLLIQSLRIDLGLGSYGVALLNAIEAEAAAAIDLPKPPGMIAGAPADINAAAGCSTVFGPWWSKSDLSAVCEPAMAVAACQSALADLKARIQTDLSRLDQSTTSVSLSGSVQVQDRSEEGEVDDLGASDLSGVWGSDSTLGQLGVPVRTAFAR